MCRNVKQPSFRHTLLLSVALRQRVIRLALAGLGATAGAGSLGASARLQQVVGTSAIAYAVLRHAAVLELNAVPDALAELLVGHEHRAHVVKHLLGVEVLHRRGAFALERQAEVTQAGQVHRVSLQQLVGDEVGQQVQRRLHLDGCGGGVLGGGAGHRLAAQRRRALRRAVPLLLGVGVARVLALLIQRILKGHCNLLLS